jgi:uncharacterized protein YcbK (DUF882 family)
VQVLLFGLRAINPRSATATITDWYRDATENLRVGGVANSQHLRGTAVDVRNDVAGAALAAAWRAIGGQVVDERANKNHWHLELPF